jgi:hypothetical protein
MPSPEPPSEHPPEPPHGASEAIPGLPFPIDPDALTWDDALSVLVALQADDLLQERHPVPTLLAFAGDTPLAVVGLRPFDPGEIGQALLEVLSLVVPLGADRLAFGAVGRVWSVDDPIPPVCSEGDLRQRAIVVALADARSGPCRLSTSIHPFDGTGAGLVLHPPLFPDDGSAATIVPAHGRPDGPREADTDGHAPPEEPEAGLPWEAGPAATMLVAALDQREELTSLTREADLLAQLGRVLLLGHLLSLAPDPAAELTAMHGASR